MIKSVRHTVPAWRFSLVVLMLVALVGLLVWQLLLLQVLDTERGHDFLQGQGDARTVRTERIPAYRGVISDRNGEPLAVSTPVASIWINPRHVSTEQERWAELAAAVGMQLSDLKTKITRNSHRGFVYLRRHVSPAQADEILSLDIKGVNAQREYKRYYPAGEVAAHLVGFTNIDDKGQEGVELAFNQWLQGSPGSKRVLKDRNGNVFRDIDQQSIARSGKDLALSIDMRLQHLAYRELKSALWLCSTVPLAKFWQWLISHHLTRITGGN